MGKESALFNKGRADGGVWRNERPFNDDGHSLPVHETAFDYRLLFRQQKGTSRRTESGRVWKVEACGRQHIPIERGRRGTTEDAEQGEFWKDCFENIKKHFKPQILQIAQILGAYKFQRLIVFFGSTAPSPNPSHKGRGKMFPPPRWGRLGGGAELLRFLSV